MGGEEELRNQTFSGLSMRTVSGHMKTPPTCTNFLLFAVGSELVVGTRRPRKGLPAVFVPLDIVYDKVAVATAVDVKKCSVGLYPCPTPTFLGVTRKPDEGRIRVPSRIS